MTTFVLTQTKLVLWVPEPGTEYYHAHNVDGDCECEICKQKPKYVKVVEQ